MTIRVKLSSMKKYAYYEKSVQSPDTHVKWFVSVYQDLFNKYPRALREDFCGTFRLCCEWIKRNRRNSALGLDLDPEPIRYGRRVHQSKLNAEQKRRLSVVKQDVLVPTQAKSDIIVACNFSFYIFKERKTLIKYFKSARSSLRSSGMLLLEMAGGPGMIATMRESKRLDRFTYVWDQRSFNPITHDAKYSIHFKLDSGKNLNHSFTYDWRLWTIPEVRDALLEAGFDDAVVYWESEHKGKGTGEYLRTNTGDNAYSWIAYVVGVRRQK